MTRPARVVIHLDALSQNLKRVRQLAPRARVMAVVKADAYGHGIERVGRTLAGSDAFGVSCLDEAQRLRHAGVMAPVVLLEGPFHESELDDIADLNLDLVLHSNHQIDMLEGHGAARGRQVWIKVDSGMHRLGFETGVLADAWRRVVAAQPGGPLPRLMTHFAQAGCPDDPMTSRQLGVFADACAGLPGERSAANSAAVIAFPDTQFDWVRPGLMLYGVSPLAGRNTADLGLVPAMTLQSEIIAVRRVGAGEPVGYGASWFAPESMPIGIVAAGYGDGFPRHARPGTPVLVGGVRCAMIGFASMDMLAVDLRPAPSAQVGEAVELWGRNLPIEEVAAHADTVAYELLCGVHRQRLLLIEDGQEPDPLPVQ